MIKVTMIGRLTRALEVKVLSSDTSKKVANFTIACRDVKDTEFVRCVAWNDIATTIEKFTSKGDMIYLEGKMKTKEWTDENNLKQKDTYVVIEKFEFIGGQKKLDLDTPSESV